MLELIDVNHEYGSGTPWATTALRDINFVVNEGDGVLRLDSGRRGEPIERRNEFSIGGLRVLVPGTPDAPQRLLL